MCCPSCDMLSGPSQRCQLLASSTEDAAMVLSGPPQRCQLLTSVAEEAAMFAGSVKTDTNDIIMDSIENFTELGDMTAPS